MVRLRSPAPVMLGGGTAAEHIPFHMGAFPSGQRGQTVNLLAMPSVVRIHPLPPQEKPDTLVSGFSCGEWVAPRDAAWERISAKFFLQAPVKGDCERIGGCAAVHPLRGKGTRRAWTFFAVGAGDPSGHRVVWCKAALCGARGIGGTTLPPQAVPPPSQGRA